MKKGILAIAMVAATGTVASAQVIEVGPHDRTYTGFSRGFSYIAPVAHTISNLEMPTESMVAGALASFMVEVDDVVMVYDIGNAGSLAVNINVAAGSEVLVIGNWTDGAAGTFTAANSYAVGAAPYASSILGNPVDLFRAGVQTDIADGSYVGGAGFTGLTGSRARIWVTVVPAPSALALLGLGGLVAVRRRR
ncbi:PEP-CTERM sorting domain-containing protein [Roseiflexus sp. AH-315-K22]|nr:PEP-CTERM sorting domain-containing protein [Roseiflexus sp. AH-315-K22]